MTLIMKNIRETSIFVDEVEITPGQQLICTNITPEIRKHLDNGDLRLSSDAPTRAERRADVQAIKPFKVGDPAIDGK